MLKRLSTKTEGLLNFSDYKKVKGKIIYFVFLLILIIGVIVSFAPVVWLILSAFKTPQEFYSTELSFFPKKFELSKIVDVFKYLDFSKYLANSVIVIIGAIVCAILINGLLAYALSVVKPKGYKLVFALIMASMMIPALTSIVPLFNNLVKLKLTNSYIPVWLIYGANAFYVLIMKNYFDGINKSVMEAARIDGCNNMRIFFRILMPLSLPIIGVIAIFTVNGAWSDFMLPFLVLQKDNMKTVMIKIYSLNDTLGSMPQFGIDKLLIVLIISIIPPVIFFLIFQKQIMSSVATSGMKD